MRRKSLTWLTTMGSLGSQTTLESRGDRLREWIPPLGEPCTKQRQLSPDAFPTGARRARSAPSMPGRAFPTEETGTLPGANVDPAERTYAGQADRHKRYILQKNVEHGYREWEHELGGMRQCPLTATQPLPSRLMRRASGGLPKRGS